MAPHTCRRCHVELLPRQRSRSYREEHVGRGLCGPCYRRSQADGTLADYPRHGRPRDELLAEYVELRGLGYGVVEAIRLAGATIASMEQVMQRSRTMGAAIPERDLRAISRLRSAARRAAKAEAA